MRDAPTVNLRSSETWPINSTTIYGCSAERKTLQEQNQREARRNCAKNFWKFAAQTLDDSNDDVQPTFQEGEAEEFFSTVYRNEPKVFHQPSWLPAAPLPQVSFTSDDISIVEIQQVIT